MNKRWQILAALMAALIAFNAQAQGKVYRWVDDEGVTHFGDSVPAEYATKDREVLNDYGVAVASQEGAQTADELAASAEQEQAIAEQQRREQATRARDETLLTTYLSVDEIESLRNRRTEMLDGQINYTEVYLEALREKLGRLQKDAARFRPYNSDPQAPPIHENLARELSDTLDSIIRYEKTLTDTRERKLAVVAKFDEDISRFRELKGLN
jgi:hypothetical protein